VTLQSIMGHRDIRTTYKYYAHVDATTRKAWIEKLGKRMYSTLKAIKPVRCEGRQTRRSAGFDDPMNDTPDDTEGGSKGWEAIKSFRMLGWVTGFEPATSRSTVWRSTS
jgi:hypothetical protein